MTKHKKHQPSPSTNLPALSRLHLVWTVPSSRYQNLLRRTSTVQLYNLSHLLRRQSGSHRTSAIHTQPTSLDSRDSETNRDPIVSLRESDLPVAFGKPDVKALQVVFHIHFSVSRLRIAKVILNQTSASWRIRRYQVTFAAGSGKFCERRIRTCNVWQKHHCRRQAPRWQSIKKCSHPVCKRYFLFPSKTATRAIIQTRSGIGAKLN